MLAENAMHAMVRSHGRPSWSGISEKFSIAISRCRLPGPGPSGELYTESATPGNGSPNRSRGSTSVWYATLALSSFCSPQVHRQHRE
jgi:hypothetical protein